MKVNQIVGEHKKGFRAKKYASKPQKYIEPTKPQKPEAPKSVDEDATITKSDSTGVEITDQSGVKTTIPADKTSAIMPDPDKPGEYDLNQTAIASGSAPGQPATPEGPKVGSKVEIKTAEASEESLGTMPTTEYVKGIYAAAAENGMDAPDVEAVKKQMVLAPNGEVDIMKTMQKSLQALQSPEFKQMLADLQELIKKGEAQQATNPELSRIQELAGVQTPAPAAATPQVDPKNWKVPSVEFLKKNYQHPADVIDGASPSESEPGRIGTWPPDSDFADLLMALDASYYQARQADPNYQQPGFVKDDWELVQRLLSTPEGKEYAIANWIGLSNVNDKSAEAEFNRAQHKEFEKQRNARDMARPDGVYTPGWKYDQALGTTPVQADLQKQKQAQTAQPVAKESVELDAMLKIAGLR